jgi:hypothetical protein
MTTAAAYNALQLTRQNLNTDHITKLVEHWQVANGLDSDGMAGPSTIASIELAMADTAEIYQFPAGRIWPLANLPDGRQPRITSRHWTKNPDRANPDRRHYGVDLMYDYLPTDPVVRIGDSGRTKGFWIPADTIAVACADGVVELAGPSRTGHRVWVRHGTHALGYFHLQRLLCTPGSTVKAGDPIGIVGDNPIDTDPDHLHFELYAGPLGGYPSGSVDPERWLLGASHR